MIEFSYRRFCTGMLLAAAIGAPTTLHARSGVGEPLAKVVAIGDVLTVTPQKGTRRQGELTEINRDTLTLRSDDRLWTFPIADVKTVRRHVRREVNPLARAMLYVAETCDDVSCAAGALIYIGIAAAAQGIDDLAHPPTIIYRAKPRMPSARGDAQSADR